jgi:hypothetical protein
MCAGKYWASSVHSPGSLNGDRLSGAAYIARDYNRLLGAAKPRYLAVFRPLKAAYTAFIFYAVPPPLEFLCRRPDSAILKRKAIMLDLMFIAIGIAFLGAAMLYALACERM